MAASARPATSSPDVNLGTVELVEGLLRKAGVPVKPELDPRAARAKGPLHHSSTLEPRPQYFFHLGVAVEGSKGVQWTHTDSESLRRAAALGRRF